MAKNRNKTIHCGNCDYVFGHHENYCPQCGQENHSPNQDFKHIFLELVESLFHFDTKIFNSFKPILCYPGRMTKEYLENKRARFVPPIRLFIFVSVLFFIIIKLVGGNIQFNSNQNNPNNELQVNQNLDTTTSRNSLKTGINLVFSADEKLYINKTDKINIDSLLIIHDYHPNFFSRLMMKRAVHIQKNPENFRESFSHNWLSYVSYSMFFAVPILGLIIAFIYRKLKKNYFEHFIFAIHLQTAYYLIIGFILIIDYFLELPNLGWIFFVLMFSYLLFNVRVLYDQHLVKTVFKSFFIFFSYFFVIIISLGLSIFAGLIFA